MLGKDLLPKSKKQTDLVMVSVSWTSIPMTQYWIRSSLMQEPVKLESTANNSQTLYIPFEFMKDLGDIFPQLYVYKDNINGSMEVYSRLESLDINIPKMDENSSALYPEPWFYCSFIAKTSQISIVIS